MNGHTIELWRYNPDIQSNAKLFFPRERIQPAWAWFHRYSMRLELEKAKL